MTAGKIGALQGIIFDIKRFAIHDGPGIRTTIFFKGCPLHCLWCHNPEGIDGAFELMPRPSRCAKDCFDCVRACPEAISKVDGRIVIQRSLCDETTCVRCAEACLYDALSVVGRRVTVEDLVREVDKDSLFYAQSGGGVTFSGGEPLLQHEFLASLLDELKGRQYHTALDTAGHAPYEILEKIARRIDLVLYDLKIMDEEKHKEYTGVSNRLILDNLRKLAATGKEIWIRIPLIAGVNDDDENIRRTAEFLKSLKTIENVSLLAYHKGGCEKYKNLDKEFSFQAFEPPSAPRLEAVSKIFSDSGFQVRRGG